MVVASDSTHMFHVDCRERGTSTRVGIYANFIDYTLNFHHGTTDRSLALQSSNPYRTIDNQTLRVKGYIHVIQERSPTPQNCGAHENSDNHQYQRRPGIMACARNTQEAFHCGLFFFCGLSIFPIQIRRYGKYRTIVVELLHLLPYIFSVSGGPSL
jgi:hypothetical protein